MIKKFFLVIIISITLGAPKEIKAFELDPRVKTFLIMNTYGAVGGFLLGSATLAFDAPGRAPFIGASLGLYAGLIFGSYVVVTHHIEEDRRLNPQNYIDGSSGGYNDMDNQISTDNYEYYPEPKGPVFYLNLLKYNF
tara:strand:+ start:422 stop:832 length:411 start_codon:yes stop_codon:yes gene_type:complete